MIQLLRIAGSFVMVMVVYGTYALTAVPLIEPPPVTKGPAVASEGPQPEGSNQTDLEMARLAVLFPPGALRIENPKILELDRVKLLIGEYETTPSGEVRIQPCIIVLLPAPDDVSQDEAIKRATVLEAPRGAVLRFDRPFDLTRAKIGRLIGGRLTGPITIRGAGKTDSPDDDLLVVTEEVQLTERRVWTRHPVRFRYGPHFGSGREMDIHLLPGDEATSRRSARGPNIAGLESFELARLDRLHLLLPGESASIESATATPLGATPAPPGTPAPAVEGQRAREDVPIEITCDGPFRFDAVKQEASFQDHVVVTGLRGTADQHDRLENCDRLSVYFQRRTDRGAIAADSQAAKRPGLNHLVPCRLLAVGSPLAFSVPSESVDGRAERLDYDMIGKNLTLEGNQPVFLRQKTSQIEARRLRYCSPERPWLTGRVTAAGPGWIRSEINNRPGESFEARWNGQLQLRPYEQNQVISFTGGAELLYGAIGRLSAGEIHFYLFEFPPLPGSRSPRLDPDRMKAAGNVQLGSPRISGEVAELEVWFEKGADATGGLAATSEPAPFATGQSAGATDGSPAPDGSAAPAAPQPPDSHFHVTARLLRARIVLHRQGVQPDVTELTLSDHVNLVQTRMADAGDKPVVVRGESIHVQDASKPHAALTIKGAPASFEGRGLTMVGSNINLNQGTNRLWIDGPGLMDLPPSPNDLQGRPTSGKDPVRVEWRDRMEFDGRTITVTGKVRAASRLQQLLTETLEASLNRMVRFADPEAAKNRSEFKMQELYCQGKVWMESRSFSKTDPNQQDSYEQVEAQNLRINQDSGAMTAAGPGYVYSVSRSSGGLGQWTEGLTKSPGIGATQSAVAGATADTDADYRFNYLHVRFQGGITGNVLELKREMTFHHEVHTLFGKVPTWESAIAEDRPETWGPKGGVLGTDQLTVREMPSPMGQGKTMELETIGNTRIEGQQYAAFCTRMAYDQDKGMMLLQGDGQTRATLMRQKRAGGPRDEASAQWFRYWPKTGTMESDGVGGIEINQSGAPRSPRR